MVKSLVALAEGYSAHFHPVSQLKKQVSHTQASRRGTCTGPCSRHWRVWAVWTVRLVLCAFCATSGSLGPGSVCSLGCLVLDVSQLDHHGALVGCRHYHGQ